LSWIVTTYYEKNNNKENIMPEAKFVKHINGFGLERNL
jgi:hypothetical protein